MGRRKDWTFIPALQTKEVEMHCQSCHGPMLSSVPAHFFLLPIFIKGIHCLKQGFVPQLSRCSFDPTKARVSLSCALAMRDGFTAPGTLVSVWDSRGKEEFAEKGIVECHKALVVLRSVILQELLAAGTLPLAPRWWWSKAVWLPVSELSLKEIKAAGAELLRLGQLRKWHLSTCQLLRNPRMGGAGVYCDGFYKLIYDLDLVECMIIGL